METVLAILEEQRPQYQAQYTSELLVDLCDPMLGTSIPRLILDWQLARQPCSRASEAAQGPAALSPRRRSLPGGAERTERPSRTTASPLSSTEMYTFLSK